MRRILRKMAEGEIDNLGDTSTLLDPAIVDEILHAAVHVKGIKIVSARARWLGHRLHSDIAISVDDKLPVSTGVRLAEQLRANLRKRKEQARVREEEGERGQGVPDLLAKPADAS